MDDDFTIDDAFSEAQERSELDKIFERMLDPANIHHNTDLSLEEINAFSTLATMAEKYDIKILKQWLLENLKLRVSRNRKGRTEAIKLTGNYSNKSDDEPNRFSWFRRNE